LGSPELHFKGGRVVEEKNMCGGGGTVETGGRWKREYRKIFSAV